MAGVVFLGGKAPFPRAAAQALAGLKKEKVPDFSRITIVLPGKIARRNLQQELLKLFPGGLLLPRMMTPRQLLLAGVDDSVNLPPPVAETILWGRAVERAKREKEHFSELFLPGKFPRDPFRAAGTFIQLRNELLAGGVSIAEAKDKLGIRGRELALLESFYLEELTAAGYADRRDFDRQAAEEVEFFADAELIIGAGLPDLPEILVKKFAAIEEKFPGKVELWINDPPENAGHFDQWGRPLPEIWLNKSLPGTTENIHLALTPADGARLAAVLAAENSCFSPDDCAVVLADPSLYKDFAREFSRLENASGEKLIIADPAGVPLSALRICQLLHTMAEFLQTPGDFTAAVNLIRERDYLIFGKKEQDSPAEILSLLDELQQKFTPDSFAFAAEKASSGKFRGKVDWIFNGLTYWLEKFDLLPVHEFLRKFLTAVFLNRANIDQELFHGIPFAAECKLFNSELNKLSSLPETLTAGMEKGEILKIFLDHCRDVSVTLPIPDGALAFEGRLEMPFLLQKKIIFCGMNESYFPDRIKPTAFLTDSMRRELGLRSNQGTLLRSIYHLHNTAIVRNPADVQMIVLRQDAQRSALRPSGILFGAALSDEELIARCEKLFADPEAFLLTEAPGAGKKFRLMPELGYRKTPEGELRLSVTDLDCYLRSPFEFFWSRVRKNEKIDYALCEPDERAGGTFIHAAIEALGKEKFTTADELRGKLIQNFNAVIKEHYGESLPVLVDFFKFNMIQRLEYAADVLFEEQQNGFETIAVEYDFGGSVDCGIRFGGAFFKGKADRIDYHPQLKIIRIIDIKTGSVKNVLQDHYSVKTGKFRKLQLPLYALLLQSDEYFRKNICPDIDECEIECAYLTIPRAVTDSALQVWESASLRDILPLAEEEIRRIIGEIREFSAQRLRMKKQYSFPLLKPVAADALCGVEVITPEEKKAINNDDEEGEEKKEKKSRKKADLPAVEERRFETVIAAEEAGKTRCCGCPEKFRGSCPCYHADCVNCKSFNGFKRYNLITASAGTGKTYSLASRFIQLLEFGVEPESIMAITFTIKAAGEIFDRIIRRICDMVKNPEKPDNFCRRHPASALPGLIRKLVGPEAKDLQISTIDSFFMRLIQSFAPEFGIWGDISVIDEYDDRFQSRVIRRWLQELDDPETLRELIKEADNSDSGAVYAPLKKLISKVYSFYQSNIQVGSDGSMPQIDRPVWQIPRQDVMTPEKCRSTAEELREFALHISDNAIGRSAKSMSTLAIRLNALADMVEKSISGAKLHRMGTPVNELFRMLNNRNDACWCDIPDSDALNYVVPLPDGLPGVLRRSAKHLRALAAWSERQKTLAVFKLIAKFDELYSELVRNTGKLTFSDLPALLLSIDKESRQAMLGSGNRALEMRLDARFDHYMFDEFQDTSDIQMMSLDPLFSEVFSGGSMERFRSFFCVGDLKQSIYLWRNGNPELFNYVTSRLAPLGAEENCDVLDSLSCSYRSSQVVLDTVNAVFYPYADAPENFNEVLADMRYETHVSARKDLSGYSAVFELPKSESDSENIGAKVKVIARILAEVKPLERGLSVGILFLKNKTAREYANALQEECGLPVSVEGKISVSDSMAFNVFKSLLTLALHPADKEAADFLDMLTFSADENPAGYFTAEKLAEKLNFAPGKSLAEGAAEMLFHRKLAGFAASFHAAFAGECTAFDRSRLEIICRAAENFSGTPEEFLRQTDNFGDTGRSVANTIQLMTYHKSKGLEFDMVFLPQTNTAGRGGSDPLPKTASVKYAAEGENELRPPAWAAYQPITQLSAMIEPFSANEKQLSRKKDFEKCCGLYVAMTRAKRALYMLLSCSADPKTLAMDKVLQINLGRYGKMASDIELEEELNTPGFADVPVKVSFSRGERHWFINEENKLKSAGKTVTLPTVKNIGPEKVFRASDGKEELFIPDPARRFSGYSAVETGTLLHELFRKITFIDDEFDEKEFCRKTPPEVQKIFSSALEKSSPIREALKKPAGICEVWQEKRFILKAGDNTSIPGAFDRVVIFRENGKVIEAEIADYKSDSFQSEKDCAVYFDQLCSYRSSLAQLLEVPEPLIKCRIYALKLKKVVEVPIFPEKI